jgi:hypothetical protein
MGLDLVRAGFSATRNIRNGRERGVFFFFFFLDGVKKLFFTFFSFLFLSHQKEKPSSFFNLASRDLPLQFLSMNALLGSLKRAASVAASRAPLASLEASAMLRTTAAAAAATTTAASRSFSSSSSSDDEGGKAFTASLFPGDGAFFRFSLC